jgi:hypothetical protein
MNTEQTEQMKDPNALLEKALIEEYLHGKGYSLKKLQELPEDVAKQLMSDASQYASLKLEELVDRAHFVKELHDDSSSRA